MSTAYNKLFYFSIPDNLYVAKAPEVSGACCDGVTAADAYTALDDIIDLCADSCRQNRIPLYYPLKKLESTSPSVLEVASHIVKSRKSVTLLQLQSLCYYCKV